MPFSTPSIFSARELRGQLRQRRCNAGDPNGAILFHFVAIENSISQICKQVRIYAAIGRHFGSAHSSIGISQNQAWFGRANLQADNALQHKCIACRAQAVTAGGSCKWLGRTTRGSNVDCTPLQAANKEPHTHKSILGAVNARMVLFWQL